MNPIDLVRLGRMSASARLRESRRGRRGRARHGVRRPEDYRSRDELAYEDEYRYRKKGAIRRGASVVSGLFVVAVMLLAIGFVVFVFRSMNAPPVRVSGWHVGEGTIVGSLFNPISDLVATYFEWVREFLSNLFAGNG